jgi:transglutaminase-like putative cysteine protease
MQLHIQHETIYRYSEPVKRSVQSLRLTPRHDASQRTLSWAIHAPGRQHAQVDAHGNIVHLLTFDEPHREFRIAVSGRVETGTMDGPLPLDPRGLSPLTYLAATPLTRPDEAISAWAQKLGLDKGDREAALLRLTNAVYDQIQYTPGATDVSESAVQAFARRKGVCQDQSHVFIACCRASGIPARYVSGYFHIEGEDEVASHAWVDAWLGEGRGWLGVDITHRSMAGPQHCRLAVGRDYLEACPVRGVRRGGGEEEMKVAVSIRNGSAGPAASSPGYPLPPQTQPSSLAMVHQAAAQQQQ